MSEIINKMWNGRKVKEEILIERGKLPEEILFLAYYKAEEYLNTYGYSLGSMSYPYPIGFVKGEYNLTQKWKNMDAKDKAKLDGVIISSNFRNEDVKIIFFDNE